MICQTCEICHKCLKFPHKGFTKISFSESPDVKQLKIPNQAPASFQTEKFLKQTQCQRGTFYSTLSYQIGRSQIKELVNTIIIVKL